MGTHPILLNKGDRGALASTPVWPNASAALNARGS